MNLVPEQEGSAIIATTTATTSRDIDKVHQIRMKQPQSTMEDFTTTLLSRERIPAFDFETTAYNERVIAPKLVDRKGTRCEKNRPIQCDLNDPRHIQSIGEHHQEEKKDEDFDFDNDEWKVVQLVHGDCQVHHLVDHVPTTTTSAQNSAGNDDDDFLEMEDDSAYDSDSSICAQHHPPRRLHRRFAKCGVKGFREPPTIESVLTKRGKRALQRQDSTPSLPSRCPEPCSSYSSSSSSGQKRVSFSTVEIQEYSLTLGDHPCTDSYPLSLDWEHTEPYEMDLQDYEKRPHHHQIVHHLSPLQRRVRLSIVSGLSPKEVTKKELERHKQLDKEAFDEIDANDRNADIENPLFDQPELSPADGVTRSRSFFDVMEAQDSDDDSDFVSSSERGQLFSTADFDSWMEN